MKLLVGSVFSTDDEVQELWLELQLKFLRETTNDADHVVCMTSHYSGKFDSKTEVIRAPTDPDIIGSNGSHVVGLKALIQHFKERQDEYAAFLILDSDAFPIHKSWVSTLAGAMQKWRRDVAMPMRLENLEQRFHPSIIFMAPKALPFMEFEVAMVGSDIMGTAEEDTCLPLYEGRRRGLVLPLLRSNRYNVDMVGCAVYYNMFYHHGAGSRQNFRVRSRHYWGRSRRPNLMRESDELFTKPGEFIKKLAGWTPEEYPDVSLGH